MRECPIGVPLAGTHRALPFATASNLFAMRLTRETDSSTATAISVMLCWPSRIAASAVGLVSPYPLYATVESFTAYTQRVTRKSSRYIPCFFLVPEGQHIHRIAGRFVAIQRDITGISEIDDQFAQLRQISNRPAAIAVRFQTRELPFDGLPSTASLRPIFRVQESATTLQPAPRPFGNNYW